MVYRPRIPWPNPSAVAAAISNYAGNAGPSVPGLLLNITTFSKSWKVPCVLYNFTPDQASMSTCTLYTSAHYTRDYGGTNGVWYRREWILHGSPVKSSSDGRSSWTVNAYWRTLQHKIQHDHSLYCTERHNVRPSVGKEVFPISTIFGICRQRSMSDRPRPTRRDPIQVKVMEVWKLRKWPIQSLSLPPVCMWSKDLVNHDRPTSKQYLNFNRTDFWYSSSFGVTWPSNLGCSDFVKRILPLTRRRLAVS